MIPRVACMGLALVLGTTATVPALAQSSVCNPYDCTQSGFQIIAQPKSRYDYGWIYRTNMDAGVREKLARDYSKLYDLLRETELYDSILLNYVAFGPRTEEGAFAALEVQDRGFPNQSTAGRHSTNNGGE